MQTWQCDRDGCDTKIHGSRGSKIVVGISAVALEVSGSRYEFCSAECCKIFMDTEGYLIGLPAYTPTEWLNVTVSHDSYSTPLPGGQ